jgi:hypothetical protein
MQMPMPQKGARASPPTENRLGSLAIIIAAATEVPSATRTGFPFTVMKNPSLFIRTGPPGQVGAQKETTTGSGAG